MIFRYYPPLSRLGEPEHLAFKENFFKVLMQFKSGDSVDLIWQSIDSQPTTLTSLPLCSTLVSLYCKLYVIFWFICYRNKTMAATRILVCGIGVIYKLGYRCPYFRHYLEKKMCYKSNIITYIFCAACVKKQQNNTAEFSTKICYRKS